jgi:hypothetical protein
VGELQSHLDRFDVLHVERALCVAVAAIGHEHEARGHVKHHKLPRKERAGGPVLEASGPTREEQSLAFETSS